MRVVIINKSDRRGGAAVVSFRLMEALREQGVDARMLVVEKLSDSPYVECLDKDKISAAKIKWKFLAERLKIFMENGFNRSTLFRIDTGEEGLPLWRHPLVMSADGVLINWVNQGMLSLKGFRKILQLGKPVVWTMHDMWEMTGICHHAGLCRHYERECGNCPLLGARASKNDLSRKILTRKLKIYSDRSLNHRLAFVAVSNWLKDKAMESTLLRTQRVEVIGNAFRVKKISQSEDTRDSVELDKTGSEKSIRLLFGAARLDDPIKGLDTLKDAVNLLKREKPDVGSKIELATFGDIKNSTALDGFEIPVVRLGVLKGETEVRKAYERADILVSASEYETLPGTLVEAQAYGCVPVSFNQGGQRDIMEDGKTGIIVDYSENKSERASNLADGILRAVRIVEDPERLNAVKKEMEESVIRKFSYQSVASRYIELISSLQKDLYGISN